MNIRVLQIPANHFRPGICGCDWWWDDEGNLEVRISDQLKDWREVAAIALHEASEAIMCRHAGVHHSDVDRFDVKFERENPCNKIEAGDQMDAPYRVQHGYATAVERIVASYLGINWGEYDKHLEQL